MSRETRGAVLSVTNWTYGHNREPLLRNPVSFEVLSGGLVGFVGMSGAGKSSLLQSIFDANLRISGELGFHGLPKSAKLGYMPQSESHENPLVRVRDIVADGYEHGFGFLTSRAAYTAADQLLMDCDLEGLSSRRIVELSGGQQSRVLFARAILMARNSQIVCIDEPTANLDYETSSMLYKLIAKYRNEGLSFVMVSHDLDFMLNNADSIVSIRDNQASVIDKREFESSGFLDSLFGEGL